MKQFFSLLLTIVLVISAAFTLEGHAYAYVDPGSGLLIFQIAGTVITGGVLWFRRRIRNLFRRPAASAPGPDQQS